MISNLFSPPSLFVTKAGLLVSLKWQISLRQSTIDWWVFWPDQLDPVRPTSRAIENESSSGPNNDTECKVHQNCAILWTSSHNPVMRTYGFGPSFHPLRPLKFEGKVQKLTRTHSRLFPASMSDKQNLPTCKFTFSFSNTKTSIWTG